VYYKSLKQKGEYHCNILTSPLAGLIFYRSQFFHPCSKSLIFLIVLALSEVCSEICTISKC